MLNTPQIIDIDKIVQHYKERLQIAKCLMAFGINCAENKNLTEFKVATVLQFGISKEDEEHPETIEFLKKEFRNWVIAYGFSNQVEILTDLLQEIYTILLLIDYSLSQQDRGKKESAFKLKGVNDKISTLEGEYTLGTIYKDSVKTMNNIRNCIIHRSGIVAERDCNMQNELCLQWKGMSFTKL